MKCANALFGLLRLATWAIAAANNNNGAQDQQGVVKRAEQLSRALRSIFEDGTKPDEIEKAYAHLADPEVFDPKKELHTIKAEMDTYLRERAAVAWNAKLSLEQRQLATAKETGVHENGTDTNAANDPHSHAFVRYLNAKRMSDSASIALDGHFGGTIEVNATREIELRPNPNFYGLATSSDSSAVHVPTPIYNRDPHLLQRIDWSDIDQQYRRNREQLKDLSFQKFCSETGFMRYFPAAPWFWEDRHSELDLFDCRSTEWYVNAATAPRNVLILLDTSGSMLGQRFEIARQTIEAVLGTLSDNDFFNIIHFSKSAALLEQCNGRELVQATLRNKRLLLSRLYNVTSEGKADYEHALHKAFVTLMNLPDEGVQWRTKEEAAREAAARRESGELESDPETHSITLEENVLIAPEQFMEAVRKFNGNQQRMGCQDVMMLITDGAPGLYREVFELYNRDKRVRFFSFVVGEEAKDFEQVKWMACANRGFMAHVSSMADVQEKVQQYVQMLSHTVARQKAAFTEATPIWSGTTRERMGDEFVVSVSYPVVLPDGQFMGVSSVTVPLTELAQLAHPSRVGERSHFMLLDASGYALLHPQLRQSEQTGELKAGFNSVEFPDVEIQRAHARRAYSIDCAAGTVEPHQHRTLFAVEGMRHVYPQKNHYHVTCIDGTPYMLLLALPEEDNKRLKRAKQLELAQLQVGWMKADDWRLHPKWRYCLLNDSDWAIGAEEAFRVYARQMRALNKVPEFCRERGHLVDRALLDMQATHTFAKLWHQEWERNKKNGVHMAFFAATSGLVRHHNQSLGDRFLYKQPAGGNEDHNHGPNRAYKHFVLELNANAAEADFFRRAVRQPKGQITFDLNRKTRLWLANGRKTQYGHAENETLLALAYKAVHVDGALAGVVGMEFLYDTLITQMRHIGCMPDNDRTRCYLLDEHAYVLFTSNRATRYAEFTHANIVVPQALMEVAQNITVAGRRRKGGQRAFMAQRVAQQGHVSASLELGRFFGQLNRVAEWTMELLVRRGFYKRVHFADAQSVCDPVQPSAEATASPHAAGQATAAARRVTAFLQPLLSSLLHFVVHSLSLLSALLFPPELASGLQLNTFASLLKVNDGRYPCKRHSPFYLAQTSARAEGPDGALLDSDSYERPCRQNAAQCAVRVFVSWVPHTNLLLVIIRQDSRSHCFHSDPAHCPLSQPPSIPFGFSTAVPPRDESAEEAELEEDKLQCAISRPQERQQPAQCLRDDYMEDEPVHEMCSGGLRTEARNWTGSTLLLLALLLLIQL